MIITIIIVKKDHNNSNYLTLVINQHELWSKNEIYSNPKMAAQVVFF